MSSSFGSIPSQHALALAWSSIGQPQTAAAFPWTNLACAAGACVLVWDEEGRYIVVSKQSEKLAGRPASELVGRTIEEVLPEPVAKLGRKLHRAALEAIPDRPVHEIFLVDGILHNCYLASMPSPERTGRVVVLFAMPCATPTPLEQIMTLVRGMPERETSLGVLARLTNQELEVFCLVGAGIRDQDVATYLSRSVRTVHGHCRRIMKKLHFTRRTQLVILAHQLGMVAATQIHEEAAA